MQEDHILRIRVHCKRRWRRWKHGKTSCVSCKRVLSRSLVGRFSRQVRKACGTHLIRCSCNHSEDDKEKDCRPHCVNKDIFPVYLRREVKILRFSARRDAREFDYGSPKFNEGVELENGRGSYAFGACHLPVFLQLVRESLSRYPGELVSITSQPPQAVKNEAPPCENRDDYIDGRPEPKSPAAPIPASCAHPKTPDSGISDTGKLTWLSRWLPADAVL